jgi:hypothetical protein
MVQVDGLQGGVVAQPGAITVTPAQVSGVTFSENVTVKLNGGVGGEGAGVTLGGPVTGAAGGVPVGPVTLAAGGVMSFIVVVVALIGVPVFVSVAEMVYLSSPSLNCDQGRSSRSHGPDTSRQKLNDGLRVFELVTDHLPSLPAWMLLIVTGGVAWSVIVSVMFVVPGSAVPLIGGSS